MMKKLKITVLLLLVCLMPLLFLRIRGAAQKSAICTQVSQELDELTDLAEIALEEGAEVLPDGVTRMEIDQQRGVVYYHVSDTGIVPASTYTGFFYAEDGAPHPYPGMEDYREITKMFGFRWVEQDGDSGCYAEHIDGNLYYFEAWF